MPSFQNHHSPFDAINNNPKQLSEEVSFSDLPKKHLDWECCACGKRLCLHDITEAPAKCPLCGFDYTL